MTTSWIPNADEICAEDWYDFDTKLKTKNGGQ